MADFFSKRFDKNVWITHHARKSMARRNIDENLLVKVIEDGTIKRVDSVHCWVFHHVEGRTDNLICAAVLEKDALIIKTVMINWEQEE